MEELKCACRNTIKLDENKKMKTTHWDGREVRSDTICCPACSRDLEDILKDKHGTDLGLKARK